VIGLVRDGYGRGSFLKCTKKSGGKTGRGKSSIAQVKIPPGRCQKKRSWKESTVYE